MHNDRFCTPVIAHSYHLCLEVARDGSCMDGIRKHSSWMQTGADDKRQGVSRLGGMKKKKKKTERGRLY